MTKGEGVKIVIFEVTHFLHGPLVVVMSYWMSSCGGSLSRPMGNEMVIHLIHEVLFIVDTL